MEITIWFSTLEEKKKKKKKKKHHTHIEELVTSAQVKIMRATQLNLRLLPLPCF